LPQKIACTQIRGHKNIALLITTDSGCAVWGSTNSIDDQVTGNHSMLGEYDFWLAKLSKDSVSDGTYIIEVVDKGQKYSYQIVVNNE